MDIADIRQTAGLPAQIPLVSIERERLRKDRQRRIRRVPNEVNRADAVEVSRQSKAITDPPMPIPGLL